MTRERNLLWKIAKKKDTFNSMVNNSEGYLEMELLRFTTAGSVDDGKSTLIGRLLYDSKSIFQDQMEAIEKTSKARGEEHVNLALLTDGLRAEREQGITIDVAYRYFATPKRKFIIADTPGHIQYTRNMVTGASTAHLAIILIDARKGMLEQTRRHSFIASLLQIPHLIICVNKMDLDMMVCWLCERALIPNGKYAIRHTTKEVRCIIKEVMYKVDINNLHRVEDDKEIKLNDIARITVRTTAPLFYDSYRRNRITGSVILIDEGTNETVGAGLII